MREPDMDTTPCAAILQARFYIIAQLGQRSAMVGANYIQISVKITHQPFDDVSAQAVFRREHNAARDGQTLFITDAR